ncbi:MAG: hypothetical protein IKT46_04970 [Clostridia bacterium]|nr:hypothetical protein [Clostridia bacterium]
MKIIQIINPKAGHGHAEAVKLSKQDIIRYTTKGIRDAENAVIDFCNQYKDEEIHFIVCGGDGTINEVVNGIMSADASERAFFSVAPTGSGNDFVKNFKNERKIHSIDLIRYNDRYAVNMINIGFDCNVADKTQLYKNKKLITGSSAYILGLGNVFVHKLGQSVKLTVTDEFDVIHEYDDEFLLCPVANGSFCGGGFNALPLASLKDGILDMLIVSKISRAKFLSLVGDYRKGTYIDPETKEIKPKFADVLRYIRCKRVSVSGLDSICVDGEIEKLESVEIEVVPNAIRYKG